MSASNHRAGLGHDHPVARARCAGIFLVSLLTTGCATPTETLVDANGRIETCRHVGVSRIGARMATEGQRICRTALSHLGYVDIGSQGNVGLTLRRDGQYGLIIDAVEADSAASDAGIMAGDRLLSVDGVRTPDITRARSLLFGRSGASLTVDIVPAAAERQSPPALATDADAADPHASPELLTAPVVTIELVRRAFADTGIAAESSPAVYDPPPNP